MECRVYNFCLWNNWDKTWVAEACMIYYYDVSINIHETKKTFTELSLLMSFLYHTLKLWIWKASKFYESY